MKIAADTCIYTNNNFVMEEIDCGSSLEEAASSGLKATPDPSKTEVETASLESLPQ